MKPLLTVKETAAEYGYPVSTIYRLVESGALPTVRESTKPGAHMRILREDMDRWIRAHRTPDASTGPRRVAADALPGADRYVS